MSKKSLVITKADALTTVIVIEDITDLSPVPVPKSRGSRSNKGLDFILLRAVTQIEANLEESV